jgi:hypothetical protein
MDLNGIKSKAQQVKAPPIGSGAGAHTARSLDDLTAQLRAADQRERGGLRKAAPLYAIASALFLFVFVVRTWLLPQPQPAVDLLFWGSLVGIYVLLTIGVLWRLHRLADIDYASPMRQFLTTAERRCCFMRPWDYLIAGVGCLLLGSAAGPYVVNLMTQRYFGPEHRALLIVAYCVFYAGLCVMGFVFTYKNWTRGRRPLWLGVRQTLAELTADEGVQPEEPPDPDARRR